VFSSNRILALNVGANKIVLSEFAVRNGRVPELLNYGMANLEPVAEGATSENGARIAEAVRGIMKASGIRRAPMMIALSGQIVFPRFVKLPAVASDKLLQMVQYEVEQNVPFPLDEIVWNYQFIGDASSGEQNVMIVAAKIEHVRDITDHVIAAGCEPEIIDVAPMAIYNALRFNHAEMDGCAIVLDIGARSTNLIFVEDGRIYSRCIPVAGNAITLELSKSLQITFDEAEKLKRERGFVSMGGVHVSEDETMEHVSRVIRNVLTRLHAEISRSVNFYRSQQGGSAPIRMILTGGTSLLPHLDLFFREKLQMEVEYLNPFVNVAVSGRINREQLGIDAFMLSETVGMALRRSLACPIEVNLMPPELEKRKTLQKRFPFFGLAVAGVLMSLGIWTLYEHRMAELYAGQNEQVQTRLQKMQRQQKKLDVALKSREEVQKKADVLRDLMQERFVWLKRLDAVRKSLSEGMWLTELAAIKHAGGALEGIRFVGRGWTDKLRLIEEKARANGSSATAVELLRESLKEKSVFGDTPDVRIVGTREIEAYLTEFTIEIRPGTAVLPKGGSK